SSPSCSFLLYCPPPPRHLHSFPTRRSSDLKIACVVVETGATFYVLTADLRDTAFTGLLGPRRVTALSTDTTRAADFSALRTPGRSEEHTSELQSPYDLVCRLLLEKKKKKNH